MREPLRSFNYIRAFVLGFSLNLVFYIIEEVMMGLANFFATLNIVLTPTLVAILNASGLIFFAWAIIIAVVLYFRKSEYDFIPGIFLGITFIICSSIWIWFDNKIRTLTNAEGVVYGGSLEIWQIITLLFAPLIIMSVASFLGLHKRT